MTDATPCPSCKALVPVERLTCKACGFDVFKHAVAKGAASQTSPGVATFSFGCLALLMIAVLSGPVYLLNRCSSPPKLTEREKKELRDDEAKMRRFEAMQAPLWARSATSLTEAEFQRELAKCRASISPAGAPEAYLSEPPMREALDSVRKYGDVSFAGQRRTEFGKVIVGEFTCQFRGAGFKSHHFRSTGYADNFIPG